MEEIVNLVTGCLVPRDIEEGDDSDDDGGDDDIPWVGYKDVGQLGRGKSLVTYEKSKRIKGDLFDLQTGRSRGVAGGFRITDPWWQVTILRTKKNKEKLLEPRDYFALCYRLRDDPRRFTDRVVHLFLSKLQDTLTEEDKEDGTKIMIGSWFSTERIQFEFFLKDRGLYDDLDLLNLEERLEAYAESFPEDEQSASSIPVRFKTAILQSAEFNLIKVGAEYPELMHYLPQLFPGSFKMITSLDSDKLDRLKALVEEDPGLLAFKPILSKKCGILGCETSYDALTKSGLLTKVPQNIRDAIQMYELIKRETKENGHTYIHYSRILNVLGSVIEMFEEALEFLNKNKVTKTQVENGDRNVFLTTLWKAENIISCGINALIRQDEKQPWELEVDWESDDFESVRQDNDQLRAAKLIASKPVVAISGKGGCGKTYVVTKVITSAKASRQKQSDNGSDTCENGPDDTDAAWECDRGDDSYEFKGDYPEEKEECPDKIKLLLTAPTGKAANLLGKRAKCPSFTLHQVIYSYRNQNKENPWKHEDVNTLVVDECSLVSVSTFSFLIQLLQEHAQLRRVILLGDVRQLPSIEPGNFLSDTFTSLARIGCAVELRNNHRAESARIVDNATRISKKTYPMFHPEQFSLLKLPPGNPSTSGDDYTAQDVSMKVLQLLKHDALKDHATSQFISFTRKVCDSINDLCCKNYSDHRTQEFGKMVFRTGDKICCSKNGYVNLYEEHHGVMSCQSQTTQSQTDENESEGGVERTVNYEEDTSLLGKSGDQSTLNGSLNTTAGSSKQKQNGTKKTNQIRLCNGEIFFIVKELEKQDDRGKTRTFLQLSDKDPEKEFEFWVDKGQLKKACKIKHAWARTIHTFQGSETDNVIYIVGSGSWRQNWQHVYTAVTRGRKSVFIIGREDILRSAIKRSEIKRQTSLRKQLIEKLQKNKDFNTTEIMQMSAMNKTTFHPAPSQTILPKGKHSADFCKGVPEPCEQLGQPMETELTNAAGNTTLNNTQIVTDILTSLASEHDGGIQNSDIEEYESDESQSLLTSIRPATGSRESNTTHKETRCDQNKTESKQLRHFAQNGTISDYYGKEGRKQAHSVCDSDMADINHSSGDSKSRKVLPDVNDCDKDIKTVESIEKDDANTESEPDSDDSQSLISPPTTRVRSRAKGAQQSINTNIGSSKASNSEMDIPHTQKKTCGPGGTVNMEDTPFTAIKGRNNSSKLSLIKGKMPVAVFGNQSSRTPLNLVGGRKYRYSIQEVNSPITPVMSRSNFSPNVGAAQNTSSPVTSVATDFQCHISSGISPLTCYDESFTERKLMLSDSKVFDPNNRRSMSPSSFQFDRDKRRRLSELDSIKEPMSNESMQWSEIDESDYMKLVDDSTLQQDSGNSLVVNDHSQRALTKQTHDVLATHKKDLNSTNMSVNSQWSEMDDDHYMTLDLEDINSMTFSNHGNKDIQNKDAASNVGNGIVSDNTGNRQEEGSVYERQISESNMYREKDDVDVCIPDSPSSPSIFESPPKRLKLSQSRKQGNGGDSDTMLSPLKRSLTKLKFK